MFKAFIINILQPRTFLNQLKEYKVYSYVELTNTILKDVTNTKILIILELFDTCEGSFETSDTNTTNIL